MTISRKGAKPRKAAMFIVFNLKLITHNLYLVLSIPSPNSKATAALPCFNTLAGSHTLTLSPSNVHFTDSPVGRYFIPLPLGIFTVHRTVAGTGFPLPGIQWHNVYPVAYLCKEDITITVMRSGAYYRWQNHLPLSIYRSLPAVHHFIRQRHPVFDQYPVTGCLWPLLQPPAHGSLYG